MKNRLYLAIGVLVVTFNFLVGFQIYEARGADENEDSGYQTISIFTRALQLIRQDYVDQTKVGYRELMYNAMKGMMKGLDPHSQFMEPQDFRSMQEDTRGDFGGIGLVVNTREEVLTVVSPMADSPGFEAGILPGDQILKINGTSTRNMELIDAVELLRGDIGQVVTLTIRRPSTEETKDYVLKREAIPILSVKEVKLLDPEKTHDQKIGYIRITQFSQPTAKELHEALDKLETEGMEGLVLDLRFNPGGLLNSAKDVCAEFLDPNQMVVYTEGQMPSQKRVYRTPANYTPRKKFPMVILINNGSASGSEIVAGALKDLNRAVIVGETSYGKGSVQSVIQLPDGSALRLTTQKYFTPSRKMIHEKGVEPDIRVTLTREQMRDVAISWMNEYMTEAEKKAVAGIEDLQLDRAIDVIRGMLIYRQVVNKKEVGDVAKATNTTSAKKR